MIALLATVLATTPEDTNTTFPPTVAVLAVFEDIPEKKRRLKAIRYAMRKNESITGGRDWGRVLCFRFAEDQRDLSIIEAALAKAKLTGEVREADNCEVPPKEAFLPPKPKAARLVRFEQAPMATVRSEFATLLDLELGLSAVRVQDGVQDRVCLEFAEKPRDEAVDFALKALKVDVQATEPTEDCTKALGAL